MRKNTFFAGAALGVTAIFLAAPAANAADTGSLGFIPGEVKAGEFVTVIGGCDAPGFKSAKLSSTVLEPTEIYLKRNSEDGKMSIYDFADVKKDAKPGVYPVTFKCGTTLVKSNLTIVGDDRKPPVKPATPTTKAAKPAEPRPVAQVAVKPKGAADTGAGDVVNTAAAQPGSGPGAGAFALGGGALLVTAGAGAFAFRRLRKES